MIAHIIIHKLFPQVMGSDEVTAFSVSLVEQFHNKALKYKSTTDCSPDQRLLNELT